ncbi:hypothetical protein Bpfe_006381 [Biomphalaria pfeifferi]|uniref:Uncharacterized protein n=1 Tax=Biomphalaria pfeifferi TaxID=112525 RepID=A0AAD8C0F2_BIOPF|nr:hypothetical protein Bpfe_006381 [Biomphalaria pfeifferi]
MSSRSFCDCHVSPRSFWDNVTFLTLPVAMFYSDGPRCSGTREPHLIRNILMTGRNLRSPVIPAKSSCGREISFYFTRFPPPYPASLSQILFFSLHPRRLVHFVAYREDKLRTDSVRDLLCNVDLLRSVSSVSSSKVFLVRQEDISKTPEVEDICADRICHAKADAIIPTLSSANVCPMTWHFIAGRQYLRVVLVHGSVKCSALLGVLYGDVLSENTTCY